MTRRTRRWLGVIAFLVVVGTATLAALQTGVLSGDRLVPAPEVVRIELPERGGRLILEFPPQGWMAAYRVRRVFVDHAGQRIIDADLFPAPLDTRFGMALYWIQGQGRDGPYVRLADPSGDILLDLRGFAAWRVSTLGGQPWLVAPSDIAMAGSVTTEDGGTTVVGGRPLPQVVADDDGVLLGRVIETADGLDYQPVGESEP